jgi:N-acetylglutamate synthase-like GNAT family acetyltransferase
MNSPQRATQIRTATKADAENITALINLAFSQAEIFFVEEDRVTLEDVIEYIDKGEFLLAEDNASLLGCVYLEPRGERTYLGLLSVNPNLQQSGIGSLLMAEAEDRCRQRDAKYIDILIVNLRDELPNFYKKRGYVETGTSSFPTEVKTKLPCHFINMSKMIAR